MSENDGIQERLRSEEGAPFQGKQTGQGLAKSQALPRFLSHPLAVRSCIGGRTDIQQDRIARQGNRERPVVQCLECRRAFPEGERIASMSGSIMGDECTDVWHLCPRCRVCTVASRGDDFTGVESVRMGGSVGKRQGDEAVKPVGRCSEPWHKKCRCEAHHPCFRDALD